MVASGLPSSRSSHRGKNPLAGSDAVSPSTQLNNEKQSLYNHRTPELEASLVFISVAIIVRVNEEKKEEATHA